MDASPRADDPDAEEESVDAETLVTAHETRPGRVVLTEDGNTDGWIASDLSVEPRR